MTPLRFGLVGTGYWARVTHAPALRSADGIEFAAVWGRSAEAVGKLAAEHQTADAGAADITHLVLHHENGATSTVTATLSALPPAAVAELFLWGEHGRSAAPMKTVTALPAQSRLTDLDHNGRGTTP